MSSRQLDEEAIFHIARQLESSEARSVYLDQVCAGDLALRDRVKSLLEVHEKEQSFLKSGAAEPPATEDVPPLSERPGGVVGRYRLMEQIGEGGMGVIFVAQQERPLRRKVALKVIKPGMDSKAVVARFEAERQALAMMDHPNIAKVLDAGTTESGRPYFAMELVKGVPITEYCDTNNLPIRQRLELFVQVCHAIQHAHQKGIIHRDIKPSNVLVTLHDGQPVPKVIDFGVAKALNARLTDRTIYTEHLQIVGTLLYMSPEQAEMSGLDIDTRSDIYSLGVLLYELMTGTTPFQKRELDQAGFDEQRRLIREKEPQRASVRISSLGETASAFANHCQTDPKRLVNQLRYELDWILSKAMEKDRTRRYDAATDFANDVIRFLKNEPVEACSPSMRYRLIKGAKRHAASLLVIALVALSLIGGAGTAVWQAQAARRAREIADDNARDAKLQAERANVERENAEAQAERADVEAENAKAQAKRAIEALRVTTELAKEQAIMRAMAGQETGAEESLKLIEDDLIREYWSYVVWGQSALFKGDTTQAIDYFTRACESPLEESKVAAAAMLAAAYVYHGDGIRYLQHYHAIADAEPANDLDRFFRGLAFAWVDAPYALEKIGDLFSDRGIGLVVRAEVKAHLAQARHEIKWLEDAHRDLEFALRLLPNSPYVHQIASYISLVGFQIGEGGPDEIIRKKYVEVGCKYAQALESNFQDNPVALAFAGRFYALIGEQESALNVWQKAEEKGLRGFWLIEYLHFLESIGRGSEAQDMFSQLKDPRLSEIARYAPFIPEKEKERYLNLLVDASKSLDSDGGPDMVVARFILGDENAKPLARELLEVNDGWVPYERRILTYLGRGELLDAIQDTDTRDNGTDTRDNATAELSIATAMVREGKIEVASGLLRGIDRTASAGTYFLARALEKKLADDDRK